MEDKLERIAADVVDISVKLHMDLGPGLLESVYTAVLQRKLEQRGYRVRREAPVPICYEGLEFPIAFRADLMIDDCFIVEVQSVPGLAPVHFKQLLTYLRLTGCRLGLLCNFGAAVMRGGIRRVAN